MWADGQTIKKPISCSAPRYVDYLLTWVPPGVTRRGRDGRVGSPPWRPVEAPSSGRKCMHLHAPVLRSRCSRGWPSGSAPLRTLTTAPPHRTAKAPHRKSTAPHAAPRAAPHRAGAKLAGRRAHLPDGDRQALPLGLHGAHPQHLQGEPTSNPTPNPDPDPDPHSNSNHLTLTLTLATDPDPDTNPNIFKRLFRVYAHIYYCHFERMAAWPKCMTPLAAPQLGSCASSGHTWRLWAARRTRRRRPAHH
jgi:hypothetical protein